jgi:hypothetical protein
MSAGTPIPKIFCIGFYKTGTTTLFEALKVSASARSTATSPAVTGRGRWCTLLRQIEAGDYHVPTLRLFDAFTDNPYFHLWREMYAQFPDARYILTVRDEQQWIDSCVKFYRNRASGRCDSGCSASTPIRRKAAEPASLARTRIAPTTLPCARISRRARAVPRTEHHPRAALGRLCTFPARARARPPVAAREPDRTRSILAPAWRRLRRALGVEHSLPTTEPRTARDENPCAGSCGRCRRALGARVKRARAADAYLLSFPKVGRTWVRVMLNQLLSEHFDIPEFCGA